MPDDIKEQIYMLNWTFFDGHNFFFIGPAGATQDEFSDLCARLMPEAAERLIGQNNDLRGPWPYHIYYQKQKLICMDNVGAELAELLGEHGYKRFQPKCAPFYLADDRRYHSQSNRHAAEIKKTADSVEKANEEFHKLWKSYFGDR